MKCTLTAMIASIVCLNAFGQDVNINSFGAVADGITINTPFIQSAIDSCARNKVGRVRVPAGIYIVGTRHLKTNVELFLSPGAIIKGSSNLRDYETYIPGKPCSPVHKRMFFTEDAKNVSITGSGQINGNGNNFFDLNTAKKLDAATTRFTRQKGNFRHVATGIGDGPVVPGERPYQMFVFSNCTRVSIKDIFIREAPFWCMHMADCDAVNISGIRLWNNLLEPNADGIDITSCTNVIISNCDIRSGDGAIAIPGYDHQFEIPSYKGLHHASENILVMNCNLQSYSSAVRIGFLDQNSVRNIEVNNCIITNSTRGIGIFLRDEGSLSNINFNNITIDTKLPTGDWWGTGEPIHISAVRGKEGVKLGTIEHVKFNHIICKGESGILVYGSRESVIDDVVFEDVSFDLTDSKLNSVSGGNIDLRGCMGDSLQLFQRDIPAILIMYANHIRLENILQRWSNTSQAFFTHGIGLDHFDGVTIRNFNGSASPINHAAFLLSAINGKHLAIDNKFNTYIKNVQN